jgi:hypothetical protein
MNLDYVAFTLEKEGLAACSSPVFFKVLRVIVDVFMFRAFPPYLLILSHILRYFIYLILLPESCVFYSWPFLNF